MPKLADLSWWNRDGVQLAETPPPAAHFKPEPAIHAQASSSANDRINSVEKLDGNTINGQQTANKNQPPTHPIRTPYSIQKSVKDEVATDNSFGSLKQAKSKLPESKNFDAMADRNAPSSLSAGKTSLDNAAKTTTPRLAAKDGSWRTDFALPATTKSNLDAAHNSLNKGTGDTANDAGSFARSLKNSIDRATESINKPLGDVKTKDQLVDSNSFEPNPPIEGFIPQTEKPNNDFAKSQTTTSPGTEVQPNNDEIQMAVKRFQENADQLQRLADQARQQAALLQSQPGSFKLENKQVGVNELLNSKSALTASANAKQSNNNPKTPGFGNSSIPYQSAFSNSQQFQSQPRVARSSSTPSNTLRNSMQVPADNQQQTAPESTESPGGYPTTPHGNYGPKNSFSQLRPANGSFDGAQVHFNRDFDAGSGVVTAEAHEQLSPIESQSEAGVPDQPFSNADVIVPDAIILGSGSFAPGSVSELKPSKK